MGFLGKFRKKLIADDFDKLLIVTCLITAGILFTIVAPGFAGAFVALALAISIIFLIVISITSFFFLLYKGVKKLKSPSNK